MPTAAAASSKLDGPLDGYFERIAEANAGEGELATYVPFLIGDATVGYLQPEFAAEVARHSDVFQALHDVENTGVTAPTQLRLLAANQPPNARTKALARATAALRDAGLIKGWRDELYPVTATFGEPPLALIERAAAPYFGIKSYGVHVNGYVEAPDGQLSMWVARRSRDKPTWPGKLDHIVAGGQPAGLSCAENVVKECGEEAGIPPQLAATAQPAGCVSYGGIVAEGLKRDVLFVYDIKLPPDFQPTPQDGEVESFQLLPVAEVARLVRDTQEYKYNCCLVIIDFLIRRGVLMPEQPRYAQLVAALRSGDCS